MGGLASLRCASRVREGAGGAPGRFELRRLVKILHEIGAIGMTGALAAYMVLLAGAPQESPADYALLRRYIELLSGWLLVPSLALVLLTGLLSMAVHTPFQNAGWAWLKLALGLPVFEGTLVTIDGTAQQAASMAAKAAAGELDAAAVPGLVAHEWNTLWIVMALAVAQTVIGVWRPRLRRRPSS